MTRLRNDARSAALRAYVACFLILALLVLVGCGQTETERAQQAWERGNSDEWFVYEGAFRTGWIAGCAKGRDLILEARPQSRFGLPHCDASPSLPGWETPTTPPDAPETDIDLSGEAFRDEAQMLEDRLWGDSGTTNRYKKGGSSPVEETETASLQEGS